MVPTSSGFRYAAKRSQYCIAAMVLGVHALIGGRLVLVDTYAKPHILCSIVSAGGAILVSGGVGGVLVFAG